VGNSFPILLIVSEELSGSYLETVWLVKN